MLEGAHNNHFLTPPHDNSPESFYYKQKKKKILKDLFLKNPNSLERDLRKISHTITWNFFSIAPEVKIYIPGYLSWKFD
jgi:hypothetical protein